MKTKIRYKEYVMSQRIPIVVSIALTMLLAGLSSSFIHAESADVAAGKRIYLEVCKTCHGLDGRGPGDMKFSPPAADLTSPQVQTKLDSRLYNSIHEGRANTAMGAWKYELNTKEVLDVLAYVRTFGSRSAEP
jgi:mono/diheme cytochrome c family protein